MPIHATADARSYRILYHHRTRAADGQRVHIREAQAALRALGHTVVEVAPVPSTSEAGSADTESETRKGLLPNAARRSVRRPPDLLQWAYNLYAAAALSIAAAWHRPDFIYERYSLNTVAGVWVARAFGIPLLLEVNSPLADEQARLGKVSFPRVARTLERHTLRAATRVLAVSTPLRELLERGAQLPSSRTALLPNGVRPDRFADAEADRAGVRTRLAIDEHTIVVSALAFFLPWHRTDCLVDWLGRRRAGSRIMLLLIGDGPAVPDLKAAVARLGIQERVRFTGAVEHSTVPALLAAADIAVMPDAVPYASPLKLFEYMAAGKAIVAPAQENITEIVTDGVDALTFERGDEDAMQRAIDRLVDDAALRARLGRAARETIQRQALTWEANAERIVAQFEDVVRREPTVGPELLYL